MIPTSSSSSSFPSDWVDDASDDWMEDDACSFPPKEGGPCSSAEGAGGRDDVGNSVVVGAAGFSFWTSEGGNVGGMVTIGGVGDEDDVSVEDGEDGGVAVEGGSDGGSDGGSVEGDIVGFLLGEGVGFSVEGNGVGDNVGDFDGIDVGSIVSQSPSSTIVTFCKDRHVPSAGLVTASFRMAVANAYSRSLALDSSSPSISATASRSNALAIQPSS
mmetsp:Transcript_19485/g.38215  ORF Transcript_19485/g.38215 Transcript_19485/m.38215 type:complete len:215 (+) Transcript_19485:1805-2449(+)